MTRGRQTDEELRIFREFVEAAGLSVRAGSIEPRDPPEPDITCEVIDVGVVAFELVEIVDRNFSSIAHSMLPMQEYLKATAGREWQGQCSFEDALIYVRYVAGVPQQRRRSATPLLLGFLADLPDGFAGNAVVPTTSRLADVVGSVRVTRGDWPGPEFQIEGAAWISNPIVTTVTAKFGKRYEATSPVELLAYFDLQPAGPPAAWLDRAHTTIAKGIADSAFERVWIYDASRRAVIACADRSGPNARHFPRNGPGKKGELPSDPLT